MALQQFLSAVEPQSAARKEDNRSPQINYYIGLAYEALGKKGDARKYFTLSVDQLTGDSNYILYYQGLSHLKLGNRDKATDSFRRMIAEGDKRIKQGSEIDFFAKFGEREAENVQLSNAYMLKGLGYKGLGENNPANENLKKALELSASNLYAKAEME
jgi:tetratricopeptide (TPR) repeat protein